MLLSRLMGKGSALKGGTVETGELHSVFEPLRRASRCRFRYSNKETWKRKKQNSEDRSNTTVTHQQGAAVRQLLVQHEETISQQFFRIETKNQFEQNVLHLDSLPFSFVGDSVSTRLRHHSLLRSRCVKRRLTPCPRSWGKKAGPDLH